MKVTIYVNRLPRGTQVKEGWEPLAYAKALFEKLNISGRFEGT